MYVQSMFRRSDFPCIIVIALFTFFPYHNVIMSYITYYALCFDDLIYSTLALHNRIPNVYLRSSVLTARCHYIVLLQSVKSSLTSESMRSFQSISYLASQYEPNQIDTDVLFLNCIFVKLFYENMIIMRICVYIYFML